VQFDHHGIEMRLNLGELHHVGVFVMHVEQVDLVGQLGLVERAFLDDRDVEAIRIGIDPSPTKLRRQIHVSSPSILTPDFQVLRPPCQAAR